MKVKECELYKDRTVGQPGQHLKIIEKNRSEPVLVPLVFVQQKLVMMNLPKLEFSMIAKFPNFLEKD